jgi:hypothetical protein
MSRDYGKNVRPNAPTATKKHEARSHSGVSGGKYERGPQPNYLKNTASAAATSAMTKPNTFNMTPMGRGGEPPAKTGRGNEGYSRSSRAAGAPAATERDAPASNTRDSSPKDSGPGSGAGDGHTVTEINRGGGFGGGTFTTGGGFGSDRDDFYSEWGKGGDRVPALPEGQSPYQWNPNKFDEAFSHYAQPGPPNPKPGVPYAGGGYPRPNPGQYPGPPQAKPGIGGPLGPPVQAKPSYGKAVAYSKVTNPAYAGSLPTSLPHPMFGQPGFATYGSDPMNYGGNGSIGGGFANAGYNTPSYGVNPVTAWNEFNSAQREGFSYGDPGGGAGAANTGGGSYGGGNTGTGPGGSEFGTNSNN